MAVYWRGGGVRVRPCHRVTRGIACRRARGMGRGPLPPPDCKSAAAARAGAVYRRRPHLRARRMQVYNEAPARVWHACGRGRYPFGFPFLLPLSLSPPPSPVPFSAACASAIALRAISFASGPQHRKFAPRGKGAGPGAAYRRCAKVATAICNVATAISTDAASPPQAPFPPIPGPVVVRAARAMLCTDIPTEISSITALLSAAGTPRSWATPASVFSA